MHTKMRINLVKPQKHMPAPSPTLNPPLPIRDGISPSYLWLPEGQWPDLLTFLTNHFSDVKESTWLTRLAKNEVVDIHGNVLKKNSPAKRGMCIFTIEKLTRRHQSRLKRISCIRTSICWSSISRIFTRHTWRSLFARNPAGAP